MAIDGNNSNVSSLGDFEKLLLDSGARSYFTPFLEDLIKAVQLSSPLNIKVADGTILKSTHVGEPNLNFISDEGTKVEL